MELVLKKCAHCGALVKVLEDCNCGGCGIQCCGEEMKKVEPNSVDAVVEKHVPVYEIIDDKIKVTVNHVMEEEHFIEWISMVTEKKEITVKFNPGEKAECQFCYVEGAKLYAYCNKHGLWQTIVK